MIKKRTTSKKRRSTSGKPTDRTSPSATPPPGNTAKSWSSTGPNRFRRSSKSWTCAGRTRRSVTNCATLWKASTATRISIVRSWKNTALWTALNKKNTTMKNKRGLISSRLINTRMMRFNQGIFFSRLGISYSSILITVNFYLKLLFYFHFLDPSSTGSRI